MAAALELQLQDLVARSKLRAARERGRDMRPALRSMGQAGVNQTRKRFLDKRAPDGASWKPTRKIGGSTLIASGILLRSISVRDVQADSVAWGTNLVYAATHQFGATIRPKGNYPLRFRLAGGNGQEIRAMKVEIPARPFLGINSENLAEFAQIGLRYVAGPLTDGGGA